jgi:asparagine synthase (glutamine-hydrolysing)
VGNYAAIISRMGSVWLVADTTNSIELFYHVGDRALTVADDSVALAHTIGARQLGLVAQLEFVLAGYVRGNRTLVDDIHCTEAGAIVCLPVDGSESCSWQHSEWQWRAPTTAMNKGELLRELDDVELSVAQDLVQLLDGRPAIIPLSGGLDSRLIAMMLRRLNYKDVFCYTYGRPGNQESAMAQAVAERLGFRLVQVEYSNELWGQIAHSEDYTDFLLSRTALSAQGSVQEYPAALAMQSRSWLPTDGVVLPGHSGDFLAGGQLETPLLGSEPISADGATRSIPVQFILDKYFALWDDVGVQSVLDWDQALLKANRTAMVEGLATQLKESVRKLGGEVAPACIVERWGWGEYQGKFVANAVRTYEQRGLSWLTPLGDPRRIDFWACVPIQYRWRRRLCIEYETRVGDEWGLPASTSAASLGRLGRLRSRSFALDRFCLMAGTTLRRHKNRRDQLPVDAYATEPHAFHGLEGETVFNQWHTHANCINSFVVAQQWLAINRELDIQGADSLGLTPAKQSLGDGVHVRASE